MITIRYPDGREEQRMYAIASGAPPIGIGRPLPENGVVELMPGCIKVTGEDGDEGTALTWPWAKITELELGPVVEQETILREDEEIPF